MDRRAFLRRAALVAAVGLAGCSGSGDGSDGGDTAAPTTTGAGMSTTTSGPTTGTATPPPGGTETTADGTSTSTTVDMEPQGSVTVLVGPGGNLRFDPEFFVLRECGTVTWEWESSGHNVRPSQKPEGSTGRGRQNPPSGRSTPATRTTGRSSSPASTPTSVGPTRTSGWPVPCGLSSYPNPARRLRKT